MSKSTAALFKKLDDIPSLIPASETPDEKIRVIISKIFSLAPANLFIVESHFLPGHSRKEGAYNPAFVSWVPAIINRDNKQSFRHVLLFSWRSGDVASRIRFGWFNTLTSTIREAPMPGDTSITTTNTTSNIHIGLMTITAVPGYTFNNRVANQEDPRLLALSDGSVMVVYAGSFGKFEMNYRGNRDCLQFYSIGRFNYKSNSLEFGDSVMLLYPEGGHQKNWVPFEYNNTVHFFQSINPLHVVALESVNEERHTASIRTVFRDINTTDGVPITRRLPWQEEYGKQLRGGTPAILVRGVYLAFFHTQVNLHVFYSLNTYFMGAVTFCPHPPFSISSISAYPILLPNLYEGNWVPKFHNYVVFPSGISLDEDGKHIHVSLGYQDMSAYVMRMEVDMLLASMDFVADCNNNSSKPKR